MRIGVFLPNWVGDACMATPALRALRAHFGSDAEMLAIGRPAPCEVLRGVPWIDEFLTYRPRGRPKMPGRRDIAWELRRRRIDIAILLTNSLGTALMAFVGGARRRIGFARDARSWMLSDRLPIPRVQGKKSAIPAIDYYLQLASRLGADTSDRRMEIVVNAADQKMAEGVWDEFGWSHDTKTVVINSSGAFGAAKIWPAEKVASLSRALVQRLDCQVLIHCGPAEREDANRTARACNHPRIRSLGECQETNAAKLPLGLSKGVIRRGNITVSTDSGPRHMALALDRPVVGMFGPVSPDWTISYNVPEEIIFLGLPCQPCYKQVCPLQHHACMRDISVDRVFQAVMSRLATEEDGSSHPYSAPLPDVA